MGWTWLDCSRCAQSGRQPKASCHVLGLASKLENRVGSRGSSTILDPLKAEKLHSFCTRCKLEQHTTKRL